MIEQATQIGLWVIGFAFLARAAVDAHKVWNYFRGKSDRREVTMVETCATKAEFEKHVRDNDDEHNRLFAKISGMDRGLREEMKRDASELHEKINAVAIQVAGQTKTQEHHTAFLCRLETKMDRASEDRVKLIEGINKMFESKPNK